MKKYELRKAFFFFIEKIKQQEYISSDEINSSWEEVEKRLSTGYIFPNHVQAKSAAWKKLLWGSSAAASVFLVVAFTLWYASNDNALTPQSNYGHETSIQKLYVPNGKSMELILSDGTKVYANAGSHIVYPSEFRKDKREITVEGEAYLEVAHNPQSPFIVKTNGFDVKVLGTKFNVVAYPNEKSASVVLVEGSVQVETLKNEKVLLHPNEQIVITAEGTNVQPVDAGKYISWKDHFLLLDDDKLYVILKRLSIFYGVNIYCDEVVASSQLSGKLNLNNTMQEVIGILQKTAKLDCVQDEKGYRLYKRDK